MQLINVPQMQQIIKFVAIGENEPVMFHGPPGCAKSAGTEAAAKAEDADLIDERLGQYDSVDLRGLPDLEGHMTTWRIPDSIPFVGNPKYDPDRKKILFLDELPAAKPAVLGVAYQLILNRRIGSNHLQPNTFIVCAGNRDGDKGVQNKLPMPLNNRLTHYEVAPEAKSFVRWAATQPRMPAEILALLSFREDFITNFEPTSPEKAFATMRTWEKAGIYMTSPDMPEDIKDASIEGCIGFDAANWLRAFCRTTHDMIPIDEIEKDPLGAPVSDKGEVRWMTACGIGGRMAQHPESSTALNQYLNRMDPDFLILAWQMALGRNELGVIGRPEFIQIAEKYKAIFRSVNG
jgi:hypothetical protein